MADPQVDLDAIWNEAHGASSNPSPNNGIDLDAIWKDAHGDSAANKIVESKPQGFFANAADKLSEIPGDVMSGASTLGGVLAHPVDAVDNLPSNISNIAKWTKQNPLKAADSIGKGAFGTAGLVAGAESGAAIGASGGPFLSLLGAGVGAGVSYASSNNLWNKIASYLGAEDLPSDQEQVNQAGRDFTSGAVSGGTAKAGSLIGDALKAKALVAADKFENSALGLTQGTINKSAQSGVDIAGGTKATSAVRSAINQGILDNGTNPVQINNTATAIHKSLNEELSGIIEDADNAKGATKVYPKFNTAQDIIDDPQTPANLKDKLQTYLDDYRNSFRKNGDGSISYMQGQKVGLYQNMDWNRRDIWNDLDRGITKDLKTSIEGATDATLPEEQAGAVKELNKKIGAFEELGPTLKRNAASGQTLVPSRLANATTKARNVLPLFAAAYAKIPALTIGSVLANGAIDAASTPTGLANLASASRFGSGLFDALPNSTASSLAGLATQIGGETQHTPAQAMQSQMQGPSNIAPQVGQGGILRDVTSNNGAPDLSAMQGLFNKTAANGLFGRGNMDNDNSLVSRVIHAESSGDSNALGPVRHGTQAEGLMQIEPATFAEWAGKLDIQNPNPFDPIQNRAVGTAYLNYLKSKYNGNEKVALAAYNYGLGHVDNIISKVGSSSYDAIEPHLPEETKNYIKEIET